MAREPPRSQTMQVHAVAFSYLVQSRPLDWPTPKRELLKDPNAGDFVWRRLQYVFALPDPRGIRPSSPALTTEEVALLRRFVEQTTTLAGTSLMAAKDIVRISVPNFGDDPDVESEFSDPDVTTGFMVLLRQCYADDEEASFAKLRKVIERVLHEAGDATVLDVVKQWRKAHARLRNQTLEELVQEQLIEDGRMPRELEGPDGAKRSAVVRAQAAPAELLRTFWYSGQIHWGKHREAMSVIQADPYLAAMWDIGARQSATDLAYFYLGFALLVEVIVAAAGSP